MPCLMASGQRASLGLKSLTAAKPFESMRSLRRAVHFQRHRMREISVRGSCASRLARFSCEPLFLEIEFSLDATEDLIVDLPPVSQADHRTALGLKSLSLQLVRGHRMILTRLVLCLLEAFGDAADPCFIVLAQVLG